MIKMFRAPNGVLTPVFLCDICGERIQDAALAAVLHPPYSEEVEFLDAVYVHKGECHHLADEQLAGLGGRAPWFDMGRQMHCLLHNISITPLKLEEMAQLYGAIDPSSGDCQLGRSPRPQDCPHYDFYMGQLPSPEDDQFSQ